MPKRHDCQARQYGDQMICAPCGLTWDTNDPDPPECRKNIKRAIAKVAKIEEQAAPRNAKQAPAFPHELPDNVAIEMAQVYHANLTDDLIGRRKAMQAAYRLFLDRVEL